MESGVSKDIAMRRTKRILKIRKQDSYTRAIGGSFEDEQSQREEKERRRQEREEKCRELRIKKQDSYLRAVGEVSPDTESVSESVSEKVGGPGIRKHDSYIEAIRLVLGSMHLTFLKHFHRCLFNICIALQYKV